MLSFSEVILCDQTSVVKEEQPLNIFDILVPVFIVPKSIADCKAVHPLNSPPVELRLIPSGIMTSVMYVLSLNTLEVEVPLSSLIACVPIWAGTTTFV